MMLMMPAKGASIIGIIGGPFLHFWLHRRTRPPNDTHDATSAALPEIRFAFSPTLLLSFTTTIPTIPTSILLCLYDGVLLVLLVTAPVALLVAAPVTAVITVSCC